jgi:GDP-L-fucose synthase
MADKIYIAGQEGMVGQAVYKVLKKNKYKIIDCKRTELDLTDQKKVQSWFKKKKPSIVINAAGKVGGILDNSLYPNEYLYINTIIGLNLLKNSYDFKVKQFINLGSACIYPKTTRQPIKEEYLLSSQLEKSNEGYALAKIVVLKYCQYLQNKKKNYISLMPANLYGEGDNFDLKSSHVIPALIRKFHEAKINKKERVEVWGSGLVKREFINVNDLAQAIVFLINKKVSYTYLNIGGSEQITIKNLSLLIKEITKFNGKIFFNKKYPDGVKERKLDVNLINKLGWKSKIPLKKGLEEYYRYFLKIYKD